MLFPLTQWAECKEQSTSADCDIFDTTVLDNEDYWSADEVSTYMGPLLRVRAKAQKSPTVLAKANQLMDDYLDWRPQVFEIPL